MAAHAEIPVQKIRTGHVSRVDDWTRASAFSATPSRKSS